MERVSFLNEKGTNDWRQAGWKPLSKKVLGIPVLLVIIPFALLVLIIRSSRGVLNPLVGTADECDHGPKNETLGFGAILLLSLPSRTDRQDAMSLIGSNTGIRYTQTIDGVSGEDIAPKAHPFRGPEWADHSPAYLGSWRTHMNALRYIIDNNIETALLLEDDVDWDVRIKEQLSTLSQAYATSPLRNRSSTPVDSRHPYGMDWDILHLGAAHISFPEDPPFNTLQSAYRDVTRFKEHSCPVDVDPPGAYCWDPVLSELDVPSDHRVIVPSYLPVGLPAIAVTHRGAQRLLYQLSWVMLETTLDWSIMRLLRDGKVTGWSVLPPLFSQYKVGGGRDSDLFREPAALAGAQSNDEGVGLGLERSARKALTEAFAPSAEEPGRWSVEYWARLGVLR